MSVAVMPQARVNTNKIYWDPVHRAFRLNEQDLNLSAGHHKALKFMIGFPIGQPIPKIDVFRDQSDQKDEEYADIEKAADQFIYRFRLALEREIELAGKNWDNPLIAWHDPPRSVKLNDRYFIQFEDE